jgi:hypothetical protein
MRMKMPRNKKLQYKLANLIIALFHATWRPVWWLRTKLNPTCHKCGHAQSEHYEWDNWPAQQHKFVPRPKS